jgi:hypothetical protein
MRQYLNRFDIVMLLEKRVETKDKDFLVVYSTVFTPQRLQMGRQDRGFY